MFMDIKQFGASFVRTSTSTPHLGQIIICADENLPDGWLPCDHRMLRRSMYPELFNVIGTKYGDADGSNTAFNLPPSSSPDSNVRSIIFVGKPT